MSRPKSPSTRRRIPDTILGTVTKIVNLYRRNRCIRFEVVATNKTGHSFDLNGNYLGHKNPEPEVEFERPPPVPTVEFKMPPPAPAPKPAPVPPPTVTTDCEPIGVRIFYTDNDENAWWEEGVFNVDEAIRMLPGNSSGSRIYLDRPISGELYTAEYRKQKESENE